MSSHYFAASARGGGKTDLTYNRLLKYCRENDVVEVHFKYVDVGTQLVIRAADTHRIVKFPREMMQTSLIGLTNRE